MGVLTFFLCWILCAGFLLVTLPSLKVHLFRVLLIKLYKLVFGKLVFGRPVYGKTVLG